MHYLKVLLPIALIGSGASVITLTTLYYSKENQTILKKHSENKNEKLLSEYIENGKDNKKICKKILDDGRDLIPEAITVNCDLISNQKMWNKLESKPDIWMWISSDEYVFTGIIGRYGLLGNEESNYEKTWITESDSMTCIKSKSKEDNNKLEVSCFRKKSK
ncbi:hypothetical protein [Mycoplasma parvum]|uniref:Uncharacterized protein n=1 Tax=Mycoplasma parvum str. Indiana TaxID=1403316 RepID=U5NG79_9MOLU|nr:hypothetical protein [Mycoplasma parvum]AGX89204.1 hypothetical protein PRV_02335 [Mycoplasma parvum str. Indiana]